MKVTHFPVVDRHTALWIWIGDPAQADQSRIPDLSYIDRTPDTARIVGYLPVKSNYELVTDNILDLSHADYIHPHTLGGMIGCSKATTRTDGEDLIAEWEAINCDPPPSFRYEIPPPMKGDIWIQARWSAPAVITLAGFGAPTGSPRTAESTSLTLHSITPETASSSHYFYCSTRPYFTDNTDFTAMLGGYLERAFSTEDKPILEKQQMRIEGADFWSLHPILLSIDTAAVMARRKLEQMIANEAQSIGERIAAAGATRR
jgi:vanillate O-demethylase monooxygenase subunit